MPNANMKFLIMFLHGLRPIELISLTNLTRKFVVAKHMRLLSILLMSAFSGLVLRVRSV